MCDSKKYNLIFIFSYVVLFLLGIKTLFHGFPDTERFFAEWMDERITLMAIVKFGTLNFAPTIIMHPPLYHYLTFIPIAMFFILGKLIGFFHDKVDFVRFYFNNTHYFFFIGRMMSYIFYWLTAVLIFKITRLFYNKIVSYVTTLTYLLIPRFIFDFSTTRPETLLFLNASIFFYFFLKYYLNNSELKYLFTSAFFLGACVATKYNAIYLGSIFIPLFIIQLKEIDDIKGFVILYLKVGFLILLGFFICNPFFILQAGKYLHNLIVYNEEAKYYWNSFYSDFLPRHFKEIGSFIYLNPAGVLILLFGSWQLFKKDKRLFLMGFFVFLVYEIYFGVYLKSYSPLRYLNPLLPVAALFFSSGVNLIFKYSKNLMPVMIIFYGLLGYNYIDIWQGLSFGPTHIQKARAFIEKNIPEFTTICITVDNYIPQLNMTRGSYNYLIKTAIQWDNIPGHELNYRTMDSEENYGSVYRELRINSLMKKPQYNIVRWDNSIDSETKAKEFIAKNNIKYIITRDSQVIPNGKVDYKGIVSLIKEFDPENKRIYREVFTDVRLFLYKVK